MEERRKQRSSVNVSTCLKINFVILRGYLAIVDLLGKIFSMLDLNQLKFI
jgi:hypothetical protein